MLSTCKLPDIPTPPRTFKAPVVVDVLLPALVILKVVPRTVAVTLLPFAKFCRTGGCRKYLMVMLAHDLI